MGRVGQYRKPLCRTPVAELSVTDPEPTRYNGDFRHVADQNCIKNVDPWHEPRCARWVWGHQRGLRQSILGYCGSELKTDNHTWPWVGDDNLGYGFIKLITLAMTIAS